MHGLSFIGDQLSPGTGQTFTAVSPLDSQPLPTVFHLAGEAEVDAAAGELTTAEVPFALHWLGHSTTSTRGL